MNVGKSLRCWRETATLTVVGCTMPCVKRKIYQDVLVRVQRPYHRFIEETDFVKVCNKNNCLDSTLIRKGSWLFVSLIKCITLPLVNFVICLAYPMQFEN